MITSIELQVISAILTSEDSDLVSKLCEFDPSYYSIFKPHIEFILNHLNKYGNVPDVFTFQAEFVDTTLVKATESLEYYKQEMNRNKQHIMLLETFNRLRDLGSGDVDSAWAYIAKQCELAANLSDTQPVDIIKGAKDRANQVIEFSKQSRIPTGFPEIDKLMYGGFSTVEELVVILARTNTGKSWVCTRMMESAQKNGYPVAYYSPEMQSAYLATRFDTWRGHFQNSQLYQGRYDERYYQYIKNLSEEETSAYIIEDKDMPDGVSPRRLEAFVKSHGIKLLIIDGLSYMTDDQRSDRDVEKYKHICGDLFNISKRYGCAIVVAVQANRDTRENKDDKGEPFPTAYNAEGSDHPARIATQVFSLRQIFDQHVLDIRLEKSRMANNQKPVLSYSWDVNTGNMQYLPDGSGTEGPPIAQAAPPVSFGDDAPPFDISLDNTLEDEDVEF